MPDETARGIRPFDLTVPTQPLAPPWKPLRFDPAQIEANARRFEAERREREERARQASEVAVDEWTEFRARHADNLVAGAVLDIHQPVVEYYRVVCEECKESDLDDTVGVEWPCPTYAAMKEATDRAQEER